VAEFFDIGYSREIAWGERPEAARLIAAIADPDRGFDAIIVGEYARAFYATQATHLAPLLQEHGVQLWLPAIDGPVDLDSPTHHALLLLLGAQSRLEVQRSRFRTTAAMQAQARGSLPTTAAGPRPTSAPRTYSSGWPTRYGKRIGYLTLKTGSSSESATSAAKAAGTSS
jgi:DNA invertase Pin-like site-specific DNA recombinase